MRQSSRQPIGLYVHVPFCASKCAYCDFTSYAGREADVPRYVETIVREIARRGEETGRPAADTVFFGGGTPSLLNAVHIARILEALSGAFAIESNAEVTCECNPGTLGIRGMDSIGPHPRPLSQRERGEADENLAISFAQALREAGINRLSIGAQAKQGHFLRLLGRIHDWPDVIASAEAARRAGFENINLDLMFGLPAQTISDWGETLEAALALSPEHLSCYGLIVEEGTPIHGEIAEGRLALPDEDAEREMYGLARRMSAERGFHQYEISNFARDGRECRHNVGCWTRVPYLGFGCAAHGFFDECRTMNPPTLDAYLAGEEPKTERISKEAARFESMMLGLRMTRGVKDDDFRLMHGLSITEAFGRKLDKPLGAGLLEWQEDALRLTRLGMDMQNSVLVDLM